MSDKFDELAKGMAQSVTRRQALRRFGTGLASLVLAAVGLGSSASTARADTVPCKQIYHGCAQLHPVGSDAYKSCVGHCLAVCGMGAKKCMLF
jgi:hypothetical protein